MIARFLGYAALAIISAAILSVAGVLASGEAQSGATPSYWCNPLQKHY